MKGTILIVEDQPNFREGLKHYINQQSADWRVVGEAETGEEGWRKILQLKPDLILMDIHMPVMTGIELARQIHAHSLDVLFVMITGYQDFQYAQSALRFGALDFLLKPCSDEDISRILRTAADKLELRRTAQRTAREHMLRSVLLKFQMNEELALQFTQSFVSRQLWLIAIEDYFPAEKNYREEDVYLLQYGILNILEELICDGDEEAQAELLILTADQLVLSTAAEAPPDTWQHKAPSVIRHYLGIDIACVPLGSCEDVSSLLAAYAAFNGERAQSAAPPSGQEISGHQAVHERKNEIMGLIVSGEEHSLTGYFSGMLDSLLLQSLPEGKIMALNQTMALNQAAETLGLPPRPGQSTAELLRHMHRLEQPEQLAQWLREGQEDFARRLGQWKHSLNRSATLMEQALDYIRQHYLGELSVKQVAEHVHLNPSYFSTLFKKETGETFTNYVNKLKLQRAQVLLRNTDMRMTEICQTVGFEDSTYFSSVFKKYFHMSPSEFRQSKKSD